jgi:hypothetical protein
MSAIEYSRVCKTGGFEKVATAQQTRHDLRLKWSTWLAELRTAAYQLLNVACDQKAMFLLAEPQQVCNAYYCSGFSKRPLLKERPLLCCGI